MNFAGAEVLFALGITLFAGLSTGIGSAIALIAKSTNKKFLCWALGFSAGVMIYISFMELLPTALHELSLHMSPKKANLYLILSLFGGMGLIALIDMMVPANENPHEPVPLESMQQKSSLKRVGMMMALSIGIHNFPEGIATFTTTLSNVELGIPIAIAIAIHNIPEGIAVAVPIYHATGSRKKAFWLSFLSGLAEPVGACVGLLFLIPFWNPTLNSLVLAATAGIMIYISIDELLPTAKKYGKHHQAIMGLVFGMIFMAVSLYLML